MAEFAIYVIVGIIAQLIDGVLGMGYGVTATSFLMSAGVPPAVASASVHTAEVVSTGFSALSHLRMRNVVWTIVRRLLFPGAIGAVIGAYILTSVDGEAIKPFVAAYLLIMGIVIVHKALRATPAVESHARMGPLAVAGGFLDSIGGGGWGPIVVGTLLARGNEPRTTIGSVNFAEFFVTIAASITFLLTLGASPWLPIAGLAVGGAVAAPVAARLVGKIQRRPLMLSVGAIVIVLSVRTLARSLF
jgi:uncharacterized protein